MSDVRQIDVRSPLKWPGGKKRVLKHIRNILPSNGKRLVEPFVGGGSVFLNIEFEEYLLCDMNADLITLFRCVKKSPKKFQNDAQKLFIDANNTPEKYYALRAEFNNATDLYQRALLFMYLNRHGYNGLCRYNLKGIYNVPFGRYKKPYFPAIELTHLAKKLTRATFVVGDFTKAFSQLNTHDVVYCDPPYSPINRTANFTAYSGNAFSDQDQERLVDCALKAKESGITTVISNHFVPFTQALYASANQRVRFDVQRSISQKGHRRQKVEEVLALYQP